MSWLFQVLLDVDLGVPEVGISLPSGTFEGVIELLGRRTTRKPLPPPP